MLYVLGCRRLKIKITDLMKTPGKPFDFEFEYFPEGVYVNGEYIRFDGGVGVSATCVYTGENYNLTGTIKGRYRTVCDRCAADVGGSFDIAFNEEYATCEDLSHPDRYIFDGREIDLVKMVEDNIILAMPMKHLCRPDCRGLCAVCGCDLNAQQCDCAGHPVLKDTDTTTPLAGLKKLLDENEEV